MAEAQEIEPRIIISMFQNFKKKVYQANKNGITSLLKIAINCSDNKIMISFTFLSLISTNKITVQFFLTQTLCKYKAALSKELNNL